MISCGIIILGGVLFIGIIAATISLYAEYKLDQKEIPLVMTKLDNSQVEDDINEAVKYLKRTDSFIEN